MTEQNKALQARIEVLEQNVTDENATIIEQQSQIENLTSSLKNTEIELKTKIKDNEKATKLWEGILVGWAVTTVLLAMIISRLKKLLG